MGKPATADKLPGSAGFRDLSDYARPLARRIARGLKDTPVRAPHVTVAFGFVGFGGALAYASDGYLLALVGAAAMQAKNVLDAVDGSLARLQRRPSRIGRFLDTITDALVAAALFTALGILLSRGRDPAYATGLAGAALVTGLLQGSLFNYYSVRFRHRHGGDPTSRIEERVTDEDVRRYGGRRVALAFLRGLVWTYRTIYGWQDRLVGLLDAWAVRPLIRASQRARARAVREERGFMTAVSALGPGLQILVLDLFTLFGFVSLAGVVELFLWTVAVGGTGYAAALLIALRLRARREARTSQRTGG